MTQGIPSRDILVDRNGQITTIWLIFFEQLYFLYSNTSESNTDSIVQIKRIADQALKIAQQLESSNQAQQKEIEHLYELIKGSQETQRLEQIESSIEQLQSSLNDLSNTFSSSQSDLKKQIKNLQTQINNIANSTFVDAPEDGKTYGRKDADWAEIVAVKLSLPFFLTDGTRQSIPLTSDFQLPFFLSDGTQLNIQTVTV
jgi:ABC-type transporter Mla subunit MlaD